MPIIIPTKEHDIRSDFLSSVIMKRIASIILLTLFLYNVIGYYLTFSILNWRNNSHMSLFVKKSNSFETLRIHKSEFKNIVFKDEGKEIFYKDEMYDVKDKTIDGDFIVFQCIKDDNEKILFTSLDTHVKNNSDSNSSSDNKSNNYSKNPVKDLFCHQEIVNANSSIAVTYPTVILHLISYIPLTCHLPPPEFLLS